jgi:arsenate reductase
MSKANVLFICTGNSARTQMAEAFLRKHGGELYEAHSAGVNPRGLNPLTIQVMNEVGIDVSNQKSKGPEAYLGTKLFAYVISVCADAEEDSPTAWPGVEIRTQWSFEDPTRFVGTEAEKLAKFREVRDLIEKKIQEWLAEQKSLEQ